MATQDNPGDAEAVWQFLGGLGCPRSVMGGGRSVSEELGDTMFVVMILCVCVGTVCMFGAKSLLNSARKTRRGGWLKYVLGGVLLLVTAGAYLMGLAYFFAAGLHKE